MRCVYIQPLPMHICYLKLCVFMHAMKGSFIERDSNCVIDIMIFEVVCLFKYAS